MTPALALPPPFRLFAFERLTSTNDEARRMAAEGAAEGTLVLAESQTAGRGRRGRHWDSPPGNLYCSLVLRPDCVLAEAANLSFVAALGVAEAVRPVLPEGVALHFKWPNDVLLGGRKAAGILLESSSTEGRLDWLVLGVGLNLERFPQRTPFPATSLRAVGCTGGDVWGLVEGFCRGFGDWYERWRVEGFGPVRAAWLDRAAALDETIEVRLESERLLGRFLGLNATGALILETPDGKLREVTAGDVFFPGAPAAAAGNG
ncbi:MAG: biotin--[acetyl-CoA-carboxylase] ligase [Alphaproteobacteria bacterium]